MGVGKAIRPKYKVKLFQLIKEETVIPERYEQERDKVKIELRRGVERRYKRRSRSAGKLELA